MRQPQHPCSPARAAPSSSTSATASTAARCMAACTGGALKGGRGGGVSAAGPAWCEVGEVRVSVRVARHLIQPTPASDPSGRAGEWTIASAPPPASQRGSGGAGGTRRRRHPAHRSQLPGELPASVPETPPPLPTGQCRQCGVGSSAREERGVRLISRVNDRAPTASAPLVNGASRRLPPAPHPLPTPCKCCNIERAARPPLTGRVRGGLANG